MRRHFDPVGLRLGRTSNEAVDNVSTQVQAYGGLGAERPVVLGVVQHLLDEDLRLLQRQVAEQQRVGLRGVPGDRAVPPRPPGHVPVGGTNHRDGRGRAAQQHRERVHLPRHEVDARADATWYKSGLAGSHEIQFGTLLQPNMKGENTNLYSNGGFSYEEMLLRDPANPASLVPFHRRVYDVDRLTTSLVSSSDNAVYFQDAWKPTERLTINAGLRFDWIGGRDLIAEIDTQDSLEIGPRSAGRTS